MVSAQTKGEIRFYGSNSQGLNPVLLYSNGTRNTSMDSTAPVGVNYSALPTMLLKNSPLIAPQGRLMFKFVAETAVVVESEECYFSIPVTLYGVSPDGKVQWNQPVKRSLGREDFTGFTASGTTDITCAAATEQLLGYYTVPAGFALAIGGDKLHCYLGDNA